MAKSSATLAQLPHEVVVEVLKFLTFKEAVTAESTCRRFFKVLRQELWSKQRQPTSLTLDLVIYSEDLAMFTYVTHLVPYHRLIDL